ncbi:MAG: hypothetical protein RLY93_12295 [Sumerlaeia bacterium]
MIEHEKRRKNQTRMAILISVGAVVLATFAFCFVGLILASFLPPVESAAEETQVITPEEEMTKLKATLDQMGQDSEEGLQALRRMSELEPENEAIRSLLDMAESAKKRRIAYGGSSYEERQEKIRSQFSSWSGAHVDLVSRIKLAMNDPKSFEHVSSDWVDAEDFSIIVTTRFRGKNAFGGTVTQTVSARYSVDGNFLGMVE